MNRRPGFESSDARWQAQERALTGAPQDHADALLAEALRTLLSSAPPADFAAGVARAAVHARNLEAAGNRAERALLRVLGVAMAIGACVCALVYGDTWTTSITSAFGDGALRWGLAAAACLAISALPWRRVLPSAERSPIAG